jgi:hypothetical protein
MEYMVVAGFGGGKTAREWGREGKLEKEGGVTRAGQLDKGTDTWPGVPSWQSTQDILCGKKRFYSTENQVFISKIRTGLSMYSFWLVCAC